MIITITEYVHYLFDIDFVYTRIFMDDLRYFRIDFSRHFDRLLLHENI